MKKIFILYVLLTSSLVMAETDIEIRHNPSPEVLKKYKISSVKNQSNTLKEDNNPLNKDEKKFLEKKSSSVSLAKPTSLIQILKSPTPNFEKVQACIQEKCDVNEQDSFKRTPLMFAVASNNTEIVEILLKNGAEVNAQDRYKNSPIIIALSSENPDYQIVQMLIDADADLFSPDIENKSAFDYALLNPTLSNKIMRLVKIQPKARFFH